MLSLSPKHILHLDHLNNSHDHHDHHDGEEARLGGRNGDELNDFNIAQLQLQFSSPSKDHTHNTHSLLQQQQQQQQQELLDADFRFPPSDELENGNTTTNTIIGVNGANGTMSGRDGEEM
ncbi:hypothetical protein SCHPADRAFT_172518 [Schizopora paradoxa]|uniref:Uncharacterized protein n=1 Tax=Schizopora paradoxa TaxID=27342 RepID=A0A0H2S6K1_9AGAM|nr:hypothetical protein SCHPADRAFT_172518 [Schizopora paradoxa]